jgi:hypothetical protein
MNSLVKALYFNLLPITQDKPLFDSNGKIRAVHRFAIIIAHMSEIEQFINKYGAVGYEDLKIFTMPIRR